MYNELILCGVRTMHQSSNPSVIHTHNGKPTVMREKRSPELARVLGLSVQSRDLQTLYAELGCEYRKIKRRERRMAWLSFIHIALTTYVLVFGN